METLLTVALGLGLAAACGFRVFVPLLVMGIANRAGHLELASSFEWMGSTPALVALGVATALEIGAYYVPWLDNLLDTVAIPAAAVAGVVVTASAVTDMSPLLRWGLAVIGGGGLATGVQLATTAIRQLSSATTLGLANPVVSTAEGVGATALSILAILWPLVGAGLLVLVLVVTIRLLGRRRVDGLPASA